MAGQNLKRTAQWPEARESFYKALEVNPSNYFAHQELGDLYYLHLNDPGTALYHYRRYLDLGQRLGGRNFTDPYTATGIRSCQIKLAEHTVAQIARQQTSVEVDRLKLENDSLRQRLAEAERQLQMHAQAQAARSATPEPAPVAAIAPRSTAGPAATVVNRPVPPTRPEVANPPPPKPAPAPATRTYVVRSGDTPATIARSQNVRLPALLAANPNLDPRRLKVGQTLQIPK